MRSDYKPRRKRRIAATTVVSVISVVSLSACSTLPRDTNPQVLRSFDPKPETQPEVGPTPGQEPDLLVRDFFAAAAIPAADYGAARSFLSPEAAQTWKPGKSILVVNNIDLTTQSGSTANGQAFNVRGNVIGQLSAGGSYMPENSAFEATVRVQRVDGEWRITDLPDGVVIDRSGMRNHYEPQPLYFYEQTGKALANDRRWLYSGGNPLDGELIALLLEGPSQQLAPATVSLLPPEAEFAGAEDGVYRFTGLHSMNSDDRLRFAAQLVWTLSHAGVQAPYRVTADGSPLIENLPEMTTDDFAEFNPRSASTTVAPLYAVNQGNILRVASNSATPIDGRLGSIGNVESADISAEGTVAAVIREQESSKLAIGTIGGEDIDVLDAETISRPTFELNGQGVWVVADGDQLLRVMRSHQTGEVTISEVNTKALESIGEEISVIRLSYTGVRIAMIINGNVYIGTIARQASGEFAVNAVYNPAIELGGTALSLDWQPDGSLIVGTSSSDSPVWRVELDGSSVNTLPSGNVAVPVVSVVSSPSTFYLTDPHAMLQMPIEADSPYWREVPGLQGMRSSPIVAD